MKSFPFLKVIEVSFLVQDSGGHPSLISPTTAKKTRQIRKVSLERIKIMVRSEAEGGVVCGSTQNNSKSDSRFIKRYIIYFN